LVYQLHLGRHMNACLSFDVSEYAGGLHHPAHKHEELQFSIVLSGALRETVSGTTQVGRALSVVVKDSGVVHSNEFGPDKPKLARLSLPSGTLEGLTGDPSRSDSWKWTHDSRVAHPFLRLVQRARRHGLGRFSVDDPDVLDLLAAFTARRENARAGDPPCWVRQIVDEIRSGWNPDMSVRDIAARAGVHPVYLARCVRRWYGVGVAEEMRRARVRAAASELLIGRRTVCFVAHRYGYSDESHLCREFRDSLGITPRRYRLLVRDLE
jgi:AraC family transcriptional regulator